MLSEAKKYYCEFCELYFWVRDEIYFISNTPFCPKCKRDNDINEVVV